MNADGVRIEKTRYRLASRSEWVGWLVIATPLVMVAVTLALGALREAEAETRFDRVVESLSEAGTPVDIHSTTVAFDQRLSRESSIEWQNLLVAVHELNVRFDDVHRTIYEAQAMPLPGRPWEIEPIVSRYTEQAQPIFAALDELVVDELVVEDKPVWQPLIFQGFDTLLPEIQESRGLVRLLAVEFRFAVHHGDQARAAHALRLIQGVSRAFDWQIGLVSDLVEIAGLSAHRRLIRQSLEIGFWSDPQVLQELQKQLAAAEDYDARWLQMVASEQAMLASQLSRGFVDTGVKLFPYGAPAATRVGLLETIRRVGAVDGAGTIDHLRAIEQDFDHASIQSESTSSKSTFTLMGIPFAISDGPTGFLASDFTAAAKAYARDAMERRWTQTAVAIKRFQVEQGRWPNELQELVDVGLSRSDWLAFDKTPFGYAVGDQAATLSVPPGWKWDVTSDSVWPDQTNVPRINVHIW